MEHAVIVVFGPYTKLGMGSSYTSSYFYFKLSLSVSLMMLGFFLACVSLVWSLDILELPVFLVSILVLTLSGIIQFVGYEIEGKRPSLREYIGFILIGPIWVFRHK